MGFTDELADFFVERRFRKVDGGHLFFRGGPFGSSYQVTEDQKTELSAYLRRGDVLAAVIVINGGIIWWLTGRDDWAWWFVAILTVPIITYRSIRVRRMLKGAPRSAERLTFKEARRTTARLMTGRVALAWLALILVLAALSLLLAHDSYVDGKRGLFWFAIVCAIGPGILLMWLADIMRLKLSRE